MILFIISFTTQPSFCSCDTHTLDYLQVKAYGWNWKCILFTLLHKSVKVLNVVNLAAKGPNYFTHEHHFALVYFHCHVSFSQRLSLDAARSVTWHLHIDWMWITWKRWVVTTPWLDAIQKKVIKVVSILFLPWQTHVSLWVTSHNLSIFSKLQKTRMAGLTNHEHCHAKIPTKSTSVEN